MVFLWFSYGFPIQTSPEIDAGACKRRLCASAPVALACARTASPEAMRAWQWGIFTIPFGKLTLKGIWENHGKIWENTL